MTDSSILLAFVALTGSLAGTVTTVFAGPAVQARKETRQVLDLYREPLLAASYELQARLHNILRRDFIAEHVVADKAGKREVAVQSTLYVFAQFFCWQEIIRHQVQVLRFASTRETREVTRLLRSVTETFLTDELGDELMLWRAEQRGLGERMVIVEDGAPRCLGYAAFLAQRESMAAWLGPIERDLERLGPAGRARLTAVQHLLVTLVERLDDRRTRYPFALERA